MCTVDPGLDLGNPYTVSGYPTWRNPATGFHGLRLRWTLRSLTGRGQNGHPGTPTVSGWGDSGADPGQKVALTDPFSALGALRLHQNRRNDMPCASDTPSPANGLIATGLPPERFRSVETAGLRRSPARSLLRAGTRTGQLPGFQPSGRASRCSPGYRPERGDRQQMMGEIR